ncbi:hypothetical protein BH10PSE19_BH10PSE19_14500 [soil metagenome]
MKAVDELRKMSLSDLKKEHVELLREGLNLRLLDKSSQNKQANQSKSIRRKIAQVLTIHTEISRRDNERAD